MAAQPFLFKWQRAILWDDELSTADRHVALTLALYMDLDGKNAHPSIQTLANATRRKRNTVCSAVTALERRGWLSKKTGYVQGRRDVNRYTAKYPKGYAAARGLSIPSGQLAVSEGIQELHKSLAAGASLTDARPAENRKSVCAECELGGGHHSDYCSRRTT